jgi:predicted TPR repeat methyltransferase
MNNTTPEKIEKGEPVGTTAIVEECQPITELGVEDALRLAIHLHRDNQLDEAETLYGRILDAAPDQPDALHFLGVLLLHRGRTDAALELISKSIELVPNHGDFHVNLGNVLLVAKRVDEAVDAYRRAASLAPNRPEVHSNLGSVLGALERYDEAARAFEAAIAADPGYAHAYNNYGNLLARNGRIGEAIAYYCKGLVLRPANRTGRMCLGLAYSMLGETDAAATVFGEWLKDEPEDPIAQHLYAACSGIAVPARASDAYLEKTFDDFAESFDAKLAFLDYRAPQFVTEALHRTGAPADKRLEALDAGCGTGLCGPLIAPYVCRLEGVDLSGGMLERARQRGVYDTLCRSELTAFLERRSAEFDLVISADTLVYFGDLARVCGAASNALRPGGLLIFTVERAPAGQTPAGYRINAHGRYSHTEAYVERTLRASGFAELDIHGAVLRMEAGSPVNGMVVTARKRPHQQATRMRATKGGVRGERWRG